MITEKPHVRHRVRPFISRTISPGDAFNMEVGEVLRNARKRAAYVDRVREQTLILKHRIQSGGLENLEKNARIALEVETFITNTDSASPAHRSAEILERISGNEWTIELGKAMAEVRLPPLLMTGSVLSTMEERLIAEMQRFREAAGSSVAVTPVGTLPTQREEDLRLENLTDNPRYFICNDFAKERSPGGFSINLDGTPVKLNLDSIMAAGSICSIQPHLQCSSDEFVEIYNIAIASAAYMLAPAVGSPLVTGKIAHAESRVTVFEQSWAPDRVFFPDYIQNIIDPFQENPDRFSPIFYQDLSPEGDSLELNELSAHNGTIHRWIRPIYGVHQGKPSVRIEFRVLPVYPSPRDNIANAALFWGMCYGLQDLKKRKGLSSVSEMISNRKAKENFHLVARKGLNALVVMPFSGQIVRAREAVRRLIPVVKKGLALMKIDKDDVEKYVGVIEARIQNGQTLSDWILKSRNPDSLNESHRDIVRKVVELAEENRVLH